MDDEALLDIVYRSRPDTVDELAAVAHRSASELADALARLETRGLLTRSDDRLTYPHPAVWVARSVAHEVDALRRSSDEALARVDALVSALPDTLRDWAVGESAAGIAPIVVRHGPRAAEDLWYDTTASSGGRAEAVFPDIARFLTSDAARSTRFATAFAGKQTVRAILPASVRGVPAVAGLAERFAAAGVQFRTLDDPPSWFWIDGDMIALPFVWGESWPTSVVGVRNAALADAGRALFDELWRRADPLTAAVAPWTDLLRLMRQGITLDAASRTSGINPRTGRRRVAAAMEHYGVSTLFALGVAWAADSAREADPPSAERAGSAN